MTPPLSNRYTIRMKQNKCEFIACYVKTDLHSLNDKKAGANKIRKEDPPKCIAC